MVTLDERKVQFKQRIKQQQLEQIVKTMYKMGITVEDIQGFQLVTDKEKLAKQRDIIRAKMRASESLKKAREAKKAKQEGKTQ
jgi:2C-methyl-D-erythritol 2,4-cyclodiphosphate synthase